MGRLRRTRRSLRPAGRAASLAVGLLVGSATVAYASFGNSTAGGPLTISTASLTAPTGLSASNPCGSTTATSSSLSWTASTASATRGYSILRSTSPSGTFTSVGTVSGINTTTYTDTVPHATVADSLYVAVKSANGMDVVSLASGTKTANSGGASLSSPTAIAVTPDGSTAYLANSGAHTVTPVTLSNKTAGTAITVGANAPTALAVTPDGSTVWVADGGAKVVTPITVATNTAGSQINVGFQPNAIAIAPGGSTAWIAGQTGVRSLNLSTLALGTTMTQSGAIFTSIAITPDGTTAYLVDASGAADIWPLNLSTHTWGTPIGLSFTPQSIAISADGATGWVAGQTAIAPITLATAAVGTIRTVAGASFQDIAITPNGCWAYAADSSSSNRIVPVNTTTDTLGTSISTDTSPQAIATALPRTAYYYEVQGTRNNWTSPVSGQASLAFGQPPLTLPLAAPAITSAAGTALGLGSASSFGVTTTGSPTASLTESGSLPAGVTFVDNGDGTGTIAGTPTATGSFPLTIRASNSQGSASQSFSLNVYNATFVTSGNAIAGTTATSGSFTLNPGTPYLVLAMTNDASAGPNSLSVGVGTAFTTNPTFTQVGAQQDYNSNGDHYTAWYTTGGSGTGTVQLTVTNTIKDAYLEVIQLDGANPSTPVVTPTEGFSNAGTTAGTSATANLTGTPTPGNGELVFVNTAGDAKATNPSSSSFTLVASSYLHGGGGTGASVAAMIGSPSPTASVTLGASVVWGTMSIEITHP